MKKTLIFVYPLIIMVLLLIITNSCEEDETTSKKDPVITWSNPADMVFGTLLSATQLNATADVPGTFVYTPAVGTKLNVGANQDLKVVFTPTDAANYNTATKTVTINVTAIISITDIDGNVYHTVTIGTQVWMVENLKTTKYNDGTSIPLVTNSTNWDNLTTPGYCWYNNDEAANKNTYGALYNWYTVNTGKLCPTGWHVPTDAEWTTLVDYLGGNSLAGGKLKENGTTHWNNPNNYATNETGFTALPGGFREYPNYGFSHIAYSGFWWSSVETNSLNAWYRYMTYDAGSVFRYSYGRLKTTGFSVRCLKD